MVQTMMIYQAPGQSTSLFPMLSPRIHPAHIHLPFEEKLKTDEGNIEEMVQVEDQESESGSEMSEREIYAPKDFERGPWMDPSNVEYGRGKRHHASQAGFGTTP